MSAERAAVEPAVGPSEPDELIARVQELSARLESLADPAAREVAEEMMAALLQFHGAGLERIVEAISRAGPAGEGIRRALARDDLVVALLLIHDLHPVPLQERVARALDRVRPYMESHGGSIELLGFDGAIVHLRLQGSCSSCRASSATLELAVRQALEEEAPDLEGMVVEGVPEPGEGHPPPIAAPPSPPAWRELDGAVAGLAPQQLAGVEVDGKRLVVANVDGTLLAYGDACAGCGSTLAGASLAGGDLTCPACGRGFSLPRAGRALDDEGAQLEPVPLLRENGSVRVAIAP